MADTTSTEPTRGPVFLISSTERLRLDVGDTTFWYRRLPTGTRYDLVQQHLADGILNARGATAYELAVAQYCIRGWDNLLDATQRPVPFLEEVIAHLPLEVLQKVNELANESSPQELLARYRDQQATAPTP